MQTQIINLDMVPGGIPPMAHVSQGDTAARKLYFRILNNGELFDTTGLTAIIRGAKPDGTFFSYNCDVYQYSIQRSCTEQMTAIAGAVVCELRLIDGEGIVGTANFILSVEEDPTAGATASASQYSEFQALANAASGYASNAAGSASAAASSASAAAQSATSVANAYRYNAVATAGTSLDDYTTTGFYYFSASYTPVNIPDGATSGLLMVSSLAPTFSSGTYLKQIFFRQADGYTWRTYVRTRTASGWTDWRLYLTADDLTGAISTVLTVNLTASRAVVSDGNGKLAASGITASELNCLAGATTNIPLRLTNLQESVQTNNNLITQIMPTMGGISADPGPAVAITNDTLTALGSITLAAGLWIVIVTVRWSAGGGSSPGRRQVMVSAASDSTTPLNWASLSTIPAAPSAITSQQLMVVLNPQSATTYYLFGYQNSGVSITATPKVSSVRLGAGSIIA